MHAEQPVKHSREELYRAAEDLCIHKMGGRLYERLEAEVAAQVCSAIGSLLGLPPDPVAFLHSLSVVWNAHCEHM